jgi:RNA polymerase sigma-54 factor
MPLEVKPVNKLTYRLKLTPQMKLSMNLLQLPLVKLKEFIKQQVEENPLLEVEKVRLPSRSEEGVDLSYDFPASPITLQEHLLSQLRLIDNSQNLRQIGELIIGEINDDGYLRCSIEDIANSAKTTPSEIEEVLSLIQTFDPIGVGTRDLRECLLLQLKARGEENSLAYQIVDKYLPFLEKKRYKYIAKRLSTKGLSGSGGKVSIDRVKESLKVIASLEPKPGRSFNSEKTIRLIPDAILDENKEGYEVILNDWELPPITLNPKYKQMIKQKSVPEDAKEYLRGRLKAAQSLIDAVARRKETVKEVIEEIVRVQKDFLDKGMDNFKPMTLDRIAKRIGKHKSTVSRAVTGKYIQTPHFILELRYFLNSGIQQGNGEIFSSKAIKSKIANLIANEDKKKPLTDQELVVIFKKDKISISRRTISKYRNQLKILSSKSRRE